MTVLLRDVRDSDLPILYQHQREPEANRMTAFPPRDWEAFLAHWERLRSVPTVFSQAILDDGRVAGNIASYEMDGKREVGYWLGQAFWGRGIATQALTAFLELERQRPLYAHVAKHNHASRRVLEKCGFVVVGEDRMPPRADGQQVEEFILVRTT